MQNEYYRDEKVMKYASGMQYYKEVGWNYRSKYEHTIFAYLVNRVRLKNRNSFENDYQTLVDNAKRVPFLNLPQFGKQGKRSTRIFYDQSSNSLFSVQGFQYDPLYVLTPPNQEQFNAVDNAMRSMGAKEITPMEQLPQWQGSGVEITDNPSVTMKIFKGVLSLEITTQFFKNSLIKARSIIEKYYDWDFNWVQKIMRKAPISFSSKPQFDLIVDGSTYGIRITAPFKADKTDIETFKYYFGRQFNNLREASVRRKADGEYKLGPVSGMVRGLRYGEEDEILDEDLMAEFDPNEIGERTDPRSYGHFTQQEYGEISDIFYEPRMAKLDNDLARRFSITIKHLNKLLNKVELAQKFASKTDTVGEKATSRSLVKLKEAIDFHDLMTNADLQNLYRAVERRLPDTRMASDEYLADFYKESDVDGNYMSVQNIQEIQDMANFLSQQVHNGDTMEDWVEDKISSARQMLSDLTRYYSNGEKEMKGLDSWKFAKKQDSASGGAEGYFADIPYLRETREFAQSGEDTNVPSIDPKAQKNTPPTPSEIEQDEDVKTLGRVKVEDQSVKQDKKSSSYRGLNRNQKKVLDHYLQQRGDIEYDFDDLPVGLIDNLYKLDDWYEYGNYKTYGNKGHYQLEESVEIYIRENDTRPTTLRSAGSSHRNATTARLLAQWKCLGEE